MNRLIATPDALVTAVVGVNVPVPALITEKVTLTFGIKAELASLTTAVTVEVPPLAMAAAESDTETVVGVGVDGVPGVPPPPAAGPLKSVPPQLLRKIARNRIIVTTRKLLIRSLPNCRNTFLK